MRQRGRSQPKNTKKESGSDTDKKASANRSLMPAKVHNTPKDHSLPASVTPFLGQELERLIKRKGKETAINMLRSAGFDKGWIEKVIDSRVVPTVGEVAQIAVILNVRMCDLVPSLYKK